MPDVAGVKFPYTPQGVQQAEQFASSLAQQYGTPATQMGLGAPGYWRGGPFEMAPRLANGSPITLDLDPAVFQEAAFPNSPEIPAVGNEALSNAESINQQLKAAKGSIDAPTPSGTLPNYNAPVSVNGATSEEAEAEAEAAAKKAKRREEWRGVGLDVAKNVGTTAVTELINKKKRRVALPTPPAGGLSAGKGLDLSTLLPQGTSLGNLPGYNMANGGQPPAPIPDMMSLPPFMAPLGGGGGGPPPPGPPPPSMQMGGVLGRKMFADDGGALRGPGGPKQDLIPVWASNGEYMLSKDTVDRVGGGDHQQGVETLNRLNFGRK